MVSHDIISPLENACPHARAARAMLSEHPNGFEMYIQTDLGGSGFVMIRCDHSFLSSVLRRQAVCVSESLDGTTQRMRPNRVSFESSDDVRAWVLTVDSQTFRFSGTAPASIGAWVPPAPPSPPTSTWHAHSLLLCTAHLERWMHGTPADVNPNLIRDQFRWVGGCLLYAETDLDGFVAGFQARCPEVAAAERALGMAAHIGAGAGESWAADAVKSSHRRRVGV